MDIDKLFKTSKVPTTGNKRRMPDNPTPEALKRIRISSPTTPEPVVPPTLPSSKKAKGTARVTIEDEEEDTLTADFAPGGDADYFAEEDEEGRFFGGGLTEEQKEILNIFDNASGEGAVDPENLNAPAVRRILQRFERAVDKNQDQRSKYPDDPSRFIESEADLDATIRTLLPLAQIPTIAYPELVRSRTVGLLLGLLAHENVDIVITAVEAIHELTDEDSGEQGEIDGDAQQEIAAALKQLVDAFVENSALELLVQDLPRFNEAEESDRQGVFHVLAIFENMLGFNPELSHIVIHKTSLLKWVLERIQAKVQDENRGYAAELLAILLQENRDSRLEYGKLDGVDISLRILSRYRRKDPEEGDETEFMENVFDALCSALAEPEVKRLFFDSEGVELMIIMMKERKVSHSRSIKVLDHALSGPAGRTGCESFVEALGLKALFSSFMAKGTKKGKNSTMNEDIAHILGVIMSLLNNLASDTPPRLRLLAKFVEADYEKVARLLDIGGHARSRLQVAEAEIEREKEDLAADGIELGGDEEMVWYLRRLESGLDVLQMVDYIAAWVSMEDDGILIKVKELLRSSGRTISDMVAVLIEYHENMGEDEYSLMYADTPSQRTILEQLIPFLEACE